MIQTLALGRGVTGGGGGGELEGGGGPREIGTGREGETEENILYPFKC